MSTQVPAVNPVAMFQAALTTEQSKKTARKAAAELLLAQGRELLQPLRFALEEAIKVHKPTDKCVLTVDDDVRFEYDRPIAEKLAVVVHQGHSGWIKQNRIVVFGVREVKGRIFLQYYEGASCGLVASKHAFDDWISAFQFGIKEVAARVTERDE